ncbi:MAG: LacI family DNA-binding transcriptional regulator, partial [Verrucomicrobiae bacterium]|nr:LacI family DNA-binding transcriptional regulator [Verrucomicrobiae bacterium]
MRLKDIAERAGLSVAAISMALKNHPSLPAATIEKVKALAEEMGYVPDPALSALAAHRSRLRIHKDLSTIGLISSFSTEDGWTELASGRAVIEGAKKRATELGYKLQHLWALSEGMTPARFDQILQARGIRSLILAPFEDHDRKLNIDWSRYAVTTIEKPLHYPYFHHIIQNHYANVMLCWEKLKASGYTRAGMVVHENLSYRWNYQWESAHRLAQFSMNTPDE